jgi:peptide-methionine (S)-S-oxide reductase
LDIFFLIHNPTTPGRQGNDVGSQYRSVMFYADETQQRNFKAAVKRATQHWDGPIVTEIVPLAKFMPAEEEHQDYFNNHPENSYCSIVIEPKIVKARSNYSQWFKEEE